MISFLSLHSILLITAIVRFASHALMIDSTKPFITLVNLIASKMSFPIRSGPPAGAWHRMMGPAVGWNSAKNMLRSGPSSPHPSYLDSLTVALALALELALLILLKMELMGFVVAEDVKIISNGFNFKWIDAMLWFLIFDILEATTQSKQKLTCCCCCCCCCCCLAACCAANNCCFWAGVNPLCRIRSSSPIRFLAWSRRWRAHWSFFWFG